MKLRSIITSFMLICMAMFVHAAQPKYIFYFIGDGMGMGPVMAAEGYNRLVKGSDTRLLMTQFPVASAAMTYSFSSPITDSAAAGTALSTGTKTRNGMLGMNPDTVAVTSVAKLLFDKGYGVGVITSVPIDDATPGAFYAHVKNRSRYDDIAADLARSGYNFFAGSSLRGNAETVESVVEKGGYTIYHGMEAYNNGPKTGKTLILNPATIKSNNIGYTIDSIQGALTLPELTEAAINHLKKDSPSRFFLMVEGGNIDWAAHANDAGAVVKEVINFDQALKYAYDFYLAHKNETLIVVTADHDTGGMALGQRYGNVEFANLDYQRASKEQFMALCSDMINKKQVPTWDEMKKILSDKVGLFSAIAVKDDEAAKLEDLYKAVFVDHDTKEFKTLYSTFNGFVEQVYRLFSSKANIGWTTGYHTGNYVPVYAIGVGADNFKNVSNNIELPRKIAKIAGVEMK